MEFSYYIIVFIFVLILLIHKALFHIGNALLFHPVKCDMNIPDYMNGMNGMKIENGYIKTSDNVMIHYIYIKNPNSNLVFLYAHGNGGNIGHRLECQTVNYLLKFGSVFMFDYRGFGKSTGETTESGIYIDIKTMWEYLTVDMNIDPNNIIVAGTSLGCSVVSWLGAYLAEQNKPLPKMIIMQSGFFNLEKIAIFKFGDIMKYLRHMFDLNFNNYEYIKKIKNYNKDYKILLLHSKSDEVIPYEHSKKLAKLTGSHLIKIGGSHNYIIVDDDADRKISDYIKCF